MEPIRIVLAGMTAVQSAMLIAGLKSERRLQVVEAVAVSDVRRAVRKHAADLVIVSVPETRGFDICRALQNDCPAVKVLLVSRTPRPAAIDLYELRCLSSDASRAELIHAVEQLITDRRTERLNSIEADDEPRMD